MRKSGNYTKSPLDWDEIVRVMQNIDNYEFKLFFALVLFAGLRVGEVRLVRRRDVIGEEILVRKTKVRKGGEKYRTVPKPKLLADIIDRCLPKLKPSRLRDDYLFQNRYGKPLTREGCNYRIQLILKDFDCAQIPTCHTLRKTVANHLAKMSGNDITIPQRHLGHKSIATTAAYLDQSKARYVTAVNNFLT